MRWPFHFGKRAVGDGAAAAQPTGPPSRREWASLPAIQRAIGEAPLTAGTPEFVDSLAGSRDPDLSLEILGHHVSMDAPHGLVSGIARPIETYAPSTEMVGRPRKHEAATPVARAIEAAEPTESGGPLEGVESPDEPLPASALRPLTAVGAATLTSAAKPLTRLADADRATVAALVAPVQRAREETPASAQAAADTPAAPPASQVTTQRLTLGQSRRLGLGAPMAPLSRAVVQRSSTGSPALDSAATHLPARIEEGNADPESPGAVIGSSPSEASALPSARSVQRRSASGDIGDTASERADNLESTPVTDLRSSVPEIEHSSAAAFGLGVAASPAPAVQRVLARSLPPLYAPPPGLRSPTVPLAPGRQPLQAGRAGLEMALQAGPVPVAQPMSDRAAAAAIRPHAPFVVSRREVSADSSPIPSLPPLRLPAPPMPVVQRMAARSDGATSANEGVQGTVPAVSDLAVSGHDFALQREITPGESPAPAPGTPEAAPAPAVSGPAAPTAGAMPSPQSAQELDELARKLYEPLSAQLRRDLLVERERAGMVTDLR
jgi:hypothetical protein